MTNLPDVTQKDIRIVAKVTEHGYIRIQTSEGWEIDTIRSTDPESIASHIARLITEARDGGFEQGRAFVRRALGCKC